MATDRRSSPRTARACCARPRRGSQIINLATGKQLTIDQAGARVTGTGADRKLVWADKDGIWSVAPALAGNRKHAKKVAPDAPLRSFLASPDGSARARRVQRRGLRRCHHKKPAEILMGFQLDGEGARRKAIKAGVPLMWSHDSEWVLVQDGGQACLMHATGGEYKCWRGYTAASISSDGKYGLFLGNRDGSHKQTPDKKDAKKDKKKPAPKKAEEPKPDDEASESEEGEPGEADVAVPPPSGPLSLFRATPRGQRVHRVAGADRQGRRRCRRLGPGGDAVTHLGCRSYGT